MNQPIAGSDKHLVLLSRLLIPDPSSPEIRANSPELVAQISGLNSSEVVDFLALANSHHVVVRSLRRLCDLAFADGNQTPGWVNSALQEEQARIDHAVPILNSICQGLEEEGCQILVIKSLDHWPDLGSDLDLFSMAPPADLIRAMTQRFRAKVAARSWGDRLANKWNFMIPGLPEAVEVHVGRLGQTGELVGTAKSVIARATSLEVGSWIFRVPAVEHRIVISTLQRMYRHFYLRLCDVLDIARFLETHTIPFARFHHEAEAIGLWRGIATYLVIVSDFMKIYRGYGIDLPQIVTRDAAFGGEKLEYLKGFLRVPIMPHSMKFYAAELAQLAFHGELQSTARLSLLPGLAAAAALGQRITGSDKGIW
jgi:hypothetical protein